MGDYTRRVREFSSTDIRIGRPSFLTTGKKQAEYEMLIHLGDGEEVLACDICGREFTSGELEEAVDHGDGVLFCSECHQKYAAFFGPDYRPPKEIYSRRGVPSPGLLRRFLEMLMR